jgi:hypothetical protein
MFSSRLVLVSALALLTVACGSGYSAPTPTPTPTPTPGPVTPPDPSSITIPIGASTLGTRAFNPDELDVAAGTTVTWTNSDSIAHTSTSDANGWDSGAVAPQGHFSVAFPNAGTFHYHCAIHPGMIGTVIVR